MNNRYRTPQSRDLPRQQGYALRMELHGYADLLRMLGKDASPVIFAHQIFFPHSSATGVQTLANAVRRKYGSIEIHNLHQHHTSMCNDIARTFIEEEHGFALLLAGTLEHHAREGFPQ